MIPTQERNPKGLHLRYLISKVDGTPVDREAEYFVLRLDEKGNDPLHIAACRKAIMVYAEEIKNHLPELSYDLILRYSGKGCAATEAGTCIGRCVDCGYYR